MIRNYFKTTIRNILHNKYLSTINVIGLSIGLAVSFLILMFIWYELSYDNFHSDAHRIYRVCEHTPDFLYLGSHNHSHISGAFAPEAKQVFPEIEYVTRLNVWEDAISFDGQKYQIEKFFTVDPDFLKIFAIDFIFGNKENALNDENSIIISERMAEKYFHSKNPVGQIFSVNSRQKLNHTRKLKVTGVFKNTPENSHFHYDLLARYENMDLYYMNSIIQSWDADVTSTYIKLRQGVSRSLFESKLYDFSKMHQSESNNNYLLQPITDIHLKSNNSNEIEANGDIFYVYLFGGIAVLILLIASFNYINLATSGSLKRGREIGIRKVMGATRGQIIRQYLGESIFLTFLSLLVALVLVEIFEPIFNTIVNRDLNFYSFGSQFYLLLLVVTLFVAFLAGSYPAFYISNFHPLLVLKGLLKGSKASIRFRNYFVITQFSISIALIICSLVVLKQLSYIKNSNLGFETKNILVIQLENYELIKSIEYLKNEISNNKGVLGVTSSNFLPTNLKEYWGFNWSKGNQQKDSKAYTAYVDHNFLNFYRIPITIGDNFSPIPGEIPQIIVNQQSSLDMGVEDPIGIKLERRLTQEKFKIVGEMENFHLSSFYHPIEPAAFACVPSMCNLISIKYKPELLTETLKFIDELVTSVSATRPLMYEFLYDTIDENYAEEHRLSMLFNFFTLVAIFIACLGLFGLVSFITEQRTKEIGIRKVLGASVNSIIVMLSGYYLKWILVATIVATPLAWYYMNRWLNNFAYHTKIGGSVFVMALLIAIFISLITSGYRSLKVASLNPVKSLKYE